MKTDDLITMLSTQVEPVDRNRMGRSLALGVAFAAAVAALATLAAFGVRSDLDHVHSVTYMIGKLTFTLTVVVIATIYLLRLARPGGERETSLLVLAAPFLAVMMLGALTLSTAPRSHWDHAVLGTHWIECIISIPLIAVVPFALTIWAMRHAMPTDLRRAGAAAGLVAGGLSATGYALHCIDDSMPFVALWYGATIALCAVTGALLGPRLLRW